MTDELTRYRTAFARISGLTYYTLRPEDAEIRAVQELAERLNLITEVCRQTLYPDLDANGESTSKEGPEA